MHVGNQMVSGTTLQTNMAATRTVIVEVKYINSKIVVIHSENCKVEIPVDITAQHLSKKICRMTGTYEASKKREVREEHTTEQPEPIDTHSESDCDTDIGDENEHADQTVISVTQPTRLGRTRRLNQRILDYLQS